MALEGAKNLRFFAATDGIRGATQILQISIVVQYVINQLFMNLLYSYL
jgi:hypothetical protein